MSAESRERVVPRIRQRLSGQQILSTFFLTSAPLPVLEALPTGMKFNQDHFIQAVLPGLSNEKRRISRGKGFSAFSVHIDNSMSHNGHKVSEKFDEGSIEQAPDPPYSPYIGWLFGMLKH
jgi:hypothetical protein